MLESAVIETPPALMQKDTGALILKLDITADYAENNLLDLYTAAELREINAAKSEKRRREKMAGKLAVKLIVQWIINTWFQHELNPLHIEVFSDSSPVTTRITADQQISDVVSRTHFSISHTDDLVCAAASSVKVGIDVELIRELPESVTSEICGDRIIAKIKEKSKTDPDDAFSAEFLPILVFSQKEAVLKAAGIGITEGFADVELSDLAVGTELEAIHQGKKYQVISQVQDGYVYSLARLAEEAGQQDESRVARKPVPVSFGQEEFWLLDSIEGSGPALAIVLQDQLHGTLDVDALQRSLQYVIDRHESLRTVFSQIDGQCRAEVLSRMPAPFEVVNLSGETVRDLEETVDKQCGQELQRGFDLKKGPLLRCKLLRISNDYHILSCCFHHIISDATSALLFRRELAYSYQMFASGKEPGLQPILFQYGDYVYRQNRILNDKRMAELVDYWHAKLRGCPDVLDLPYDSPRPRIRGFQSEYIEFGIPEYIISSLQNLSKTEGVTLFVTFLAAFQCLLMHVSGQDDFAVGAPFIGRNTMEEMVLIGYFVNVLPLRADLADNPTFKELLQKGHKTVQGALEYQDLPYQKIAEKIMPLDGATTPPQLQAVLQFMQENMEYTSLAGIQQEFKDLPAGGMLYDLYLMMTAGKGRITGRLEYNPGLFIEKTARQFIENFLNILEKITGSPDLTVNQIVAPGLPAICELVESLNDTGQSIPDLSVDGLFLRQADQTPSAVAIVYGKSNFTYQHLNESANQLAHYLKSCGVGPGDCVGVAIPRSPLFVMSILAVLKCGAAYLPLDKNYPLSHLSFLMKDTGAKLLLTKGQAIEGLSADKFDIVNLDILESEIKRYGKENPPVVSGPDDLAYVMYTSGSSGRPKGVAIPHCAIVRLLFGVNYVELDKDQVLLYMAPTGFDASTFELWGALLHGGSCVLLPDKVPTLARLGQEFQRCKITTVFLTTALFNTIIDEAPEILQDVKQILFGGEKVSVSHVRRAQTLLRDTQLIHCYGPTEATTFSCCYHITETVSKDAASIPIGKPISNTSVYILDRFQKLLPVGKTGEIYIGGPGLAQGYINLPELTAEKFIPNPFSDTPTRSRLYRTGDLARYLPDGNIEFVSRLDNQFKIRGFRIEPEEIESVMQQHPSVKECVVFPRKDSKGQKHLFACVILRQSNPGTINDIRKLLLSKLPSYLVPELIFEVDELPHSINNKIDREKLQTLKLQIYLMEQGYMPPRDITDMILVGIWQGLLGKRLRPIGIDDDFFDCGGNSLLAVSMLSRLEKQTGQKLPISVMYENATIRALSKIMMNNVSCKDQSPVIKIQQGNDKVPFFFMHGDFTGGGLYVRKLARLIGQDQPFYIIQPHGLEGEPLLPSIEKMAENRLRFLQSIQPHGPYLLGGHCNGALVAMEMAQLLLKKGEAVDLLVLIEPAITSMTSVARTILDKAKRQSTAVQNPFYSHNNLKEDPDTERRILLINSYAYICASYSPVSYPQQLILIEGESGQVKSDAGLWRSIADDLKVITIPGKGGHLKIITRDLEKVAVHLKRCLHEASFKDGSS